MSSCASALPAPLAADAGAPRACAYALIDALAGIHAFDWQRGGLDDFGRPDGYLERQVPRWLGQLERYKTRPLPEVDEAGRWLAGAHAADAAAGGDPRRLQARQRDVRAAPPGRARRGRRLGAVDGRRSARRPRLGDRAVGRVGRRARRSRARRRSPAAADVPTRRELLDRYADSTDRDLVATSRSTACSACSSSRA